MTDASSGSSPKPQDALPWLDRALQFRYALLIGSIVLTVDVARTPLRALGLPPLDWTITGTAVPIGTLLAIVCIYLFFMSGISPMLRTLIESALTIFIDLLSDNQSNHHASEKRYARGYVRVSEARSAALKEKDSFWITRINEHEAGVRSRDGEARFMASVSFSCLLLLVLECSVGDRASWMHVAGLWLLDLGSTWIDVVVGGIAITSMILIGAPWWFEFRRSPIDDDRAWIEHPRACEAAQTEESVVEPTRRDRNCKNQ